LPFVHFDVLEFYAQEELRLRLVGEVVGEGHTVVVVYALVPGHEVQHVAGVRVAVELLSSKGGVVGVSHGAYLIFLIKINLR